MLKAGGTRTDAHQFEWTRATSSFSLQPTTASTTSFEHSRVLLVVVPILNSSRDSLSHCHHFLSLNCHLIATIDSSNHSTPRRDLLPSSTPTESTLEIDPIANRTSQTTLAQRITTDSTVPSLVPATRSRSELEQGSSADLLSSSISIGIVFIFFFVHLVIYQSSFLSRTRQTPKAQELGNDNDFAARAPVLLLTTTP